ncbi:MAG: mitofilin family membrane protein [Rhodomicrobiaceae bacterium]
MTTNNGPDDKKPEKTGREQRPYATLDLTATDVSAADEKPSPPKSAAPAASDSTPEDPPPMNDDHGDRASPPPPRDITAASLTSHLGAGALGAILALIFGYVIFWNDDTAYVTREETAALQTQIASAQEKMTGLETQIGQAASQSDALNAANANVERLEKQLQDLTARLAAVEDRPTASAPTEQAMQQSLDPVTARLKDVEDRLAALGKAQEEMRTDGRGSALALALYNLRRAADDGKPFGAELKSVAEMSPVPLDLDALEPLGSEGVPSIEQLKTGFETAASAALEAEHQPGDDSLSSTLWSKVSSLVRVRRKGNVAGEGTRAILARTEFQLDRGSLVNALSEARQLQGPARDAMNGWIERLEARIAAEDALDKVETQLLTALGRDETAKRGG